MERPPPHLGPFASVPADLPKRFLLLFLGMAAFYTLPVGVIALIAAIAETSSKGPAALLGILKALPLLGIGGAAALFARRAWRDLKEAKERRFEDARRAEARARSRGSLEERARAVAGLAVDPAASPAAGAPPVGGRFLQTPEQLARLRCTWCGTAVSVALADEASGNATCPSCGTVFSMRAEMQTRMGLRQAPLGLDVEKLGDGVIISHQTHAAAGCGLTLGVFVLLLLTLPDALTRQSWAPTAVVATVLAAVIVISRVFGARRTLYTITNEGLAVRIDGTPARVLGHWQRGEVDQVFLRERKRRRRRSKQERSGLFADRRRHETTSTYDIILRQADDREVRLMKDMANLSWALFIEQEIENRLGIEDRVMGKGPRR